MNIPNARFVPVVHGGVHVDCVGSNEGAAGGVEEQERTHRVFISCLLCTERCGQMQEARDWRAAGGHNSILILLDYLCLNKKSNYHKGQAQTCTYAC
jgi:hypothetical protein